MPRQAKDLLGHLYRPQRQLAQLNDVMRRVQRIERAPVRIFIPLSTQDAKDNEKKLPPRPKSIRRHRGVTPSITPASTVLATLQLDIVVNQNGDGGDDSAVFSLNEKTYIFSKMANDYVDMVNPQNDPPAGWTGVLTGQNASNGYRWWHSIKSESLAIPAELIYDTEDLTEYHYRVYMTRDEVLAQFETGDVTVVDTSFFVARSNSDGSPYDGRAIGSYDSFYINTFPSPHLELDHVRVLSGAYIFPFDLNIDDPKHTGQGATIYDT